MFGFGKKDKSKNKGEAEKFVEDALPVVEVKVSDDGMWYQVVYPEGKGFIVEPISRASSKDQVLAFVKNIYSRRHKLVLPAELQ